MDKQKIIISVLVLLFWSCSKNEPKRIVSWKTLSPPYYTLLNIDSINNDTYNFKDLKFILFVDSLLKETSQHESLEGKKLEVSEYQISASEETFFNGDGYIMFNIYHPDWPWNHRFIFNKKIGIVGLLPSHSMKKHYLVSQVIGTDTTYRLTSKLLTFLQQDTILNPPPPTMPKDLRVIEVEIDIDEEL
jgi:hypothetical protein